MNMVGLKLLHVHVGDELMKEAHTGSNRKREEQD